VQDISIKRNAEDYLKRMNPIAVALDKAQSDTCKISDAVEVWKELSHDMEASQSLNVARKVQHCYGQALTSLIPLIPVTWGKVCLVLKLMLL